jgi:hypothetical protein
MPIPRDNIVQNLPSQNIHPCSGSMSCHPILLEHYHFTETVTLWCYNIQAKGLNSIRNSDDTNRYAIKSDGKPAPKSEGMLAKGRRQFSRHCFQKEKY